MATKQEILAAIASMIVENSQGDITATVMAGILNDIVGLAAFEGLEGTITAKQIPDAFLVARMFKDDQIDADKFVTAVRDSLAKANAALPKEDSVMLVGALPNPLPKANTVLVLRDPVDSNDEGVYVVKEHTGAYYEGYVEPSIDSVIALQCSLDHNPNGSLSEIEWTVNGLHIYIEVAASAFAAEPPANLYLEATHTDAAGGTIGAADELSSTDKTNSRVTLSRQASFDRGGHYSYGQQLTGATFLFWGAVDDGYRLRFQIYTDNGFSTPLVTAGGKYFDLITDNKFPRQTDLARLAQGGATKGQGLVWNDTKQTWEPGIVQGVLAGTRLPTPSDGVDGNFWIAGLDNGSTLSISEKVGTAWVELGRAHDSEDAVEALQHLTRDLHTVRFTTDWEDMDDNEVDLAWAVPVNNAITLADTDFDGNGASVTIPASTSERTTYVFVRLPAATDVSLLRVEVSSGGVVNANHWGLAADEGVTVPSSTTYQYWMAVINLNETAGLSFQMQKREKLERSRFDGDLGGEAAERLVAKGGTKGQVYKKKSSKDGDGEWAFDAGTEAYAYYAAPALSSPDVTSDQSISRTGDGYKHTLLDAWTAPKGIVAGADFITEWEGVLTFEVKTTCNLEVILRTKHSIGAKQFSHERKYFLDAIGGARTALPMSIFNSRSRVSAGAFGGVTLTDADLLAAADITYEVEFRSYARKSNSNRSTNTMQFLGGSSIEVASYQDGGSSGAQGAFYFRLYAKGATKPNKPTSGGYELDNDSYTVAPNIWGIQVPTVDESKGERVWAIESPIDPANDAGKTIDLTDPGRWGSVFPVTGKTGAAGSSTDTTARRAAAAAMAVADAALPKAGGTMAGKITLDGDPTDDLHAASKGYVDKNASQGGGDGGIEVLDELPEADDYDVGAIVAVQDGLYELGITDENAPNIYEGTVGRSAITLGNERWRGISNSQSPNGFSTDGGWTANPNSAISLLMASSAAHIRFAIKHSVYETAKGSDFVTTDKVAIKITFADGDTDEAVCAYYNSYTRDVNYLEFQHQHATDNYNLYSEAAGNAIKVEFFTVDGSGNATTTPFLTHEVSAKHWLPYPPGGPDSNSPAYNLAQANAARLDALDAAVDGGATPIHNVTYDDTTALTAPLAGNAGDFAVETTYNDVRPTDLIVIDWKKAEHLNHHSEHVVPGSGSDAGRMYVSVSQFDNTEWDGEILYALEHAIQDNGAADELNSWIVASIVWDSPNLTFGLHLQQGGSRTNRNLTARPGFSVQMRVFRNATPAQAISDNIHARVLQLTAQMGGHSLVTLTDSEYTNLASKAAKTIYITIPDSA